MELDSYGRARKKRRNPRNVVPPVTAGGEPPSAEPGQVVVRLRRDRTGIAAVGDDPVATLPVYGQPPVIAAVTNRSGIADLDQALEAVGATAVWRAVDTGTSVAAAEGDAPVPELNDLLLVEFPRDRSTEEVIATLNESDAVLEAGPSGGFSIAFAPNDPGFAQQWGVVDVRCPQAWDITTGDPAVVVAVVDTGCDLVHLDLLGQFAGSGTNTVTPGGSAQDAHGHGTHVGGIIAATGNNGRDVVGAAWTTTILPVKALDSSGRAIGTSIAQGITWAASRCSVMNLSLQGSVDDITVRIAIEEARRLGVVVVAAMGNFAWDETRPSYPAAYARTHDNVLAVGAVDREHRRSVWGPGSASNTGSWIGLVAPGTNIDSLRRGGGVTTMSGTSQACPHVAAAAALLRSAQPGLTPQEVVAALTGTAAPLRDTDQDPVPNSVYGHGLLDVEAALRSIGGTASGPPAPAEPAPPAPAEPAPPAPAGPAPVDLVEPVAAAAAEPDAGAQPGAAAARPEPDRLHGLADRAALDYLLESHPELLRRLVDDPDAILRELGAREEDLQCPPVAHDALERGRRVAAAAEQLTGPLTADLPQLRRAVEAEFGAAFAARKIPFGVRFAEEVRASENLTLTGTASVECTFGIGCRPDVDR